MDLKLKTVLCILICVASVSSAVVSSTEEREASSEPPTDAQTRIKRTIGVDESYEREYELKTKKGATLTVKKSIKYNDGGAIVHLPTLLDTLAENRVKVLEARKKAGRGHGASASASASASAAPAPPQLVVLHEVEQVPVPVPPEPVLPVFLEHGAGPSYPAPAYGKKQAIKQALPMVKLGHKKLLSGERRGLLTAAHANSAHEPNDLLGSRSARDEPDHEADEQREQQREPAQARSAQQSWSEKEAALLGKLSVGLAKVAAVKKIGPPCCPDGSCCPDNYQD